ncbi:disulfide bond formation protein B [Spongorhabdus nitratireducens]
MQIPGSRPLFMLSFLGCAFLTGMALYFEHGMGLEPCPLCISQRLVVIVIALFSLSVVLHNPGPKGLRIYGLLTALGGIGGAVLASRQLWLQSLPSDQVPACLPSVEYLIEVLPFTELLTIMFSGTGDCAKVKWEMLGISMPGWTLVAFIIYALFGCFELLRKREKNV